MNYKNHYTKIALAALMATSVASGVMANVSALSPLQNANYTVTNGATSLGSGKASIHISPNGNQTLVGKKFTIYKLFNAENAKGLESINYTWNEDFAPAMQKVVGERLGIPAASVTEYQVIDYIQTLNNHVVEGAQADQILEGRYSDFRYFVEDLKDTIEEMGLSSKADTITIESTKADRSFDINGLDYAYYLVDENNVGNNNDWSAASLCMTNTANPTAEIQVKSDYPSLIKKINEDDNNIGWNDIADFEIGQTVPYKYESNIPNMNGYHTYYYAWHDVMDEALTFDASSVVITISDGTKSYTLGNDEFSVQKDVNGETFVVAVNDIKAIVDREFANFNEDQENVYGQSVTLTYNATLNDKAAEHTGRPGFENDVRLEFSQNPDSEGEGETGFTQWDTVVCFTYNIDGLKTNNHDVVLEGAHFRLYSDEACENEVFVKQMADGSYNVINRDSLGGNDHTGGNAPAEAVEMVSDENGVFKIFGLDQGTYWLKETDSPDGYRELLDPIKITITPTFTDDRQGYVKGDGATDLTLEKLEAHADFKEFLGGIFTTDQSHDLTTDVESGTIGLTVVNTVGTKLPITGAVTGAAIMLAGAAGLVVSARKRKENKEEAE